MNDDDFDAATEDETIGPDRRRHQIRWVAVAIGICMVAFIGVLATRKPTEQRFGESPLISKAVPVVSGPTIDGKSFDIDRHKGQWVLVNFFATWCVPCRMEHPELKKFSDQHKANGDAVVVSVVYNDSPDAVRAFFAENGGDWPVVIGDTGPTALDFGVTGVPESYLVTPNGAVASRLIGGVTDPELEALLAQANGTATGR